MSVLWIACSREARVWSRSGRPFDAASEGSCALENCSGMDAKFSPLPGDGIKERRASERIGSPFFFGPSWCQRSPALMTDSQSHSKWARVELSPRRLSAGTGRRRFRLPVSISSPQRGSFGKVTAVIVLHHSRTSLDSRLQVLMEFLEHSRVWFGMRGKGRRDRRFRRARLGDGECSCGMDGSRSMENYKPRKSMILRKRKARVSGKNCMVHGNFAWRIWGI